MKTAQKDSNLISIKKEKRGNFTITKDENFAHLIAMSFAFHSQYMEAVSKEKNQILQESPKFLKLMENLSTAQDTVSISNKDLKLLNEWVKCITEIIIELPSVDLKDENFQKFFRLSQSFVAKVGKVI